MLSKACIADKVAAPILTEPNPKRERKKTSDLCSFSDNAIRNEGCIRLIDLASADLSQLGPESNCTYTYVARSHPGTSRPKQNYEEETLRLLQRLFPTSLDNEFRGHKIALYVFYALTALTLWRSQHHLFADDGGAQSIATIPLDTYSSNAAETVIGIFALWGVSQLIVGLIYLLAAIRYRALIPFLYVMFTFEYAMRLWVGANKTIETADTAPGSTANFPFMIAGVILFALSVWRGKEKS